MTTPVHIMNGRGPKNKAGVTSIGQLIVASFAYDDTVFIELAEPDTAYSFYRPLAGQQFVITGIRAKADRQVSPVTDAEVIIYEAGAADTLTVDKVLHEDALVAGEDVTLLPLNLLVNEGKFVNAKTSDDDIHMTIFGYYIPKLT